MSHDTDYYKTIQQEAVAEFKDRGSKFLAYAFPVNNTEDFKNRLNKLKTEHPKAAHFCFAYRLGNDGNNFRASDDKEPSGSAGKPILGQIDSKELINTAIIVVRYFGGSLLGVPGLINAYKTASALALQLSPVVRKPVAMRVSIEFDYTQMNEVQRRIKSVQGAIIVQELQLFCKMIAEVPKNKTENLQNSFRELKGINFIIIP